MKYFKITSLILAVILFLGSCGGAGGEVETDAAAETAEITTAETTTDRADNLPRDLDFGGRTVKCYAAGKYSIGYTAEDSADIISDLIYRRNAEAEETLNLKIETEYCPTEPWFNMSERVKTAVMAGEDDIDLICGSNWYNTNFVFNGWVRDLSDAPYIDITQDWWAGGYINGMSYAGHYYYLTGPIELGYLSGMICFYANTKLWEGLYEENVHAMVRDGSWTLDKLISLGEGAYADLNGDGVPNDGDIYGFAVATDFECEYIAYGCGVKIAPFDESGTPHLAFIEDPTRLISFWEKWYNIKTNPNFVNIIWNPEIDTNHVAIEIFKRDELLFMKSPLGIITSLLRDMESEYAILPIPKLDESQQDYIAVMTDGNPIYSSPITASEDGFEAAMALLEFCAAKSYAEIMPAYLEDALKNKYIRDVESVETINMLTVHPLSDFGALYLDLGFYSFLRYDVKDENIASAIEKKAKSFNKTLEKMLKTLEGG